MAEGQNGRPKVNMVGQKVNMVVQKVNTVEVKGQNCRQVYEGLLNDYLLPNFDVHVCLIL